MNSHLASLRLNDRVQFHSKRGFETGIIVGFKGKYDVIIVATNGTGKPYHYRRPHWKVKKTNLLYDDLLGGTP